MSLSNAVVFGIFGGKISDAEVFTCIQAENEGLQPEIMKL